MSPICLFLSLAPAVWLSLSSLLFLYKWMGFYSHPCSFCFILWLIVLVSVFLCTALFLSFSFFSLSRTLSPCFWRMMISMKAHSYDNKFLIILHPPRGWGLSICALNWSVSQCTPLTLQIKDIYQKVNLQSPPAHRHTQNSQKHWDIFTINTHDYTH